MLRNLITTLRRFKLASTLNVVGLAVAFATFSVMMIQVTYEYGYGKNDPNYKEIYRLESLGLFWQGKWLGQTPAGLVRHLENDEPRVKSIYYCDASGTSIDVSSSDTTNSWVSTGFYANYVKPTNVFEFTMVEGSIDQLPLQGNAIIPQSLAKVLFPNGSAVGQTLYSRGRYYREGNQNIVGVYRDFPDNSLLKNWIFLGMPKGRSKPESGLLFDAQSVYLRCLPADTALIMQGVRNFCANNTPLYGGRYSEMRLTPIGEAYFASDFYSLDHETGSSTTTLLLLGISILIIIIASINFINFSTALAPVRIVGLNTRHVFGKTKGGLRAMLIFEATALAAIAYVVALFLVYCFSLTSYASLIRADSIAFEDNVTLLCLVGGGALMVGFLAGLYPAIYCTRFDTATILKGNGMGSRSGQWMRLTLIGFQYVISIGLIIGSLFIAQQNRYLANFPLGFNKENVFVLESVGTAHNQKLRLVNNVLENPNFTDYTISWGVLGVSLKISGKMPFATDTVDMQYMMVEHNFMDFFQIPIIAGRNFTETDFTFKYPDKKGFFYDENPGIKKAIFNRKAQEMYGVQVDSIYGGRVQCIGICDNYNTSALYNEMEPSYFLLDALLDNIYLRYNGEDVAEAYDFIHAKHKEVFGAEESFECSLLDSKLNEAYVKERDLSKIIMLLSIVAIILSLVGVFGLVVFENQYRRKEIGIRKVFGSRVGQILVLFTRKFIIICAVAFIIALPVAYYLVNQWLGSFAFKTPMHWWIFALGLLIVALLTIITVIVQSYRSATENPVNSLKSE